MLLSLTLFSLLTFKLIDYCSCKKEKNQSASETKPHQKECSHFLTDDANDEHYLTHHGSPDLTEYMIKIHISEFEETEREAESGKFLNMEKAIHENEANAIVCMRMKIDDPRICQKILEDAKPGLLKHFLTLTKIKQILAKFKKVKILLQISYILDRAKTVILYYVDLLKDTTLSLKLLSLLGVPHLIAYPTTFSSQIVFISLTSAFMPMILAAVIIASNPLILAGFCYQNQFHKITKWKLLLLKIITFVLSPLVPALLFDVKEREKKNLEKCLLTSDHNDPEIRTEIKERRKFLLAVKKKILTLKKLELTIEVVPQISILSLMILLKNSNTNLETGLEAVFDAEPIGGMTIEMFLIFNILWSLQTEIFTSLKVKKEAKGFLPSTGSLILLVKNTLTITTRITCIVMYFVPFLGCFNLATHWKAEQIQLEHSSYQFPDAKYNFYYQGKSQSMDWRSIYRSNVEEVKIT